MDTDKQAIYDFLKAHQLAVVSTGASAVASPESALVAYVEDESLALYFQTGENTRKATNLSKNQHASFVIGLDLKEMATLQYEGCVEQLTLKTDIEACKARFLAKESPSAPDFLSRPGVQFYRVKPTWIRLYRANHSPVVESRF
jgi:general stress protein 26